MIWIHIGGFFALVMVTVMIPRLRRSLGTGLMIGAVTLVIELGLDRTGWFAPATSIVFIAPVCEELTRYFCVRHVRLNASSEPRFEVLAAILLTIGLSYVEWSRHLLRAAGAFAYQDWDSVALSIASSVYSISLHLMLTMLIYTRAPGRQMTLFFLVSTALHIGHNYWVVYGKYSIFGNLLDDRIARILIFALATWLLYKSASKRFAAAAPARAEP